MKVSAQFNAKLPEQRQKLVGEYGRAGQVRVVVCLTNLVVVLALQKVSLKNSGIVDNSDKPLCCQLRWSSVQPTVNEKDYNYPKPQFVHHCLHPTQEE